MSTFSHVNLVLFVGFSFVVVLHVKAIVWSSKAIQILVTFLYNNGVHSFRSNRAHRNQEGPPVSFHLKPVAEVILYRDF